MGDKNYKGEVVAIYFPSWHPDPHYQSWYGKGFTEWELVKTAKPLFQGHLQPKVPEWGYFDESNPLWAEKQIDLAADNGITVFMFDWYWYSGVRFLSSALEKGFLKADNSNRLKFCVMWANHTWSAWPAVTGIPGMTGQHIWLPIRHWLEDTEDVCNYCCENYFVKENYWKINGMPVFIIYDISTFTKLSGGKESAREAIQRMNDCAKKWGFPGLWFVANIGCCGDNIYCCGWDRVPDAETLGFSAIFAYNIVRTPDYPDLPESMPVVSYENVIASHKYAWNKIEEKGLIHFPVVTFGCDVTPRWHRGVKLPFNFKKLNYEPIVTGNTPEKFGELCRLAINQSRKNREPRAIFINAWNEWTEGMYLLPEKKYGTSYLQALKSALQSFENH